MQKTKCILSFKEGANLRRVKGSRTTVTRSPEQGQMPEDTGRPEPRDHPAPESSSASVGRERACEFGGWTGNQTEVLSAGCDFSRSQQGGALCSGSRVTGVPRPCSRSPIDVGVLALLHCGSGGRQCPSLGTRGQAQDVAGLRVHRCPGQEVTAAPGYPANESQFTVSRHLALVLEASLELNHSKCG